MLNDVNAETDSTTAGVIEWLNSSGATVELFAARTLATHGLTVSQGVYLSDPESDTAREIDVIGAREVHLVGSCVVGAYLVVECKFTPNPWVILRGRPKYESSVPNFDRVTSRFGHEWLKAAQVLPAVREGHAFRQEPRPGHALVTAHVKDADSAGQNPNKRNVDSAYAAIMGATKAARAWADLLTDRIGTPVLGVVFPVVVVRGGLYEAWLQGDAITARPITSGQVYWNHPSVSHPVLVDVVADSALDNFTRRFRETADGLVSQGQDAARAVNTTGVY